MTNTNRVLGAVVGLLATLAVIVAGCGSPSAKPAGQATTTAQSGGKALTAQEIANNSLTAYSKLASVKMDMDMDMDVKIEGKEPMDIKMVADATGSIDVAKSEMQLTMDMDAEIPVLGKQKISTEMYMVGGWIYQKVSIPMMGDQWMKTPLTQEMRKQQDQLAQQMEMLKTAIEITSLGSETVDGVDCFVLQIKPDMKVLAQWAQSQVPDQAGTDALEDVDLAKMFKSFSIKQWIAKKDFMAMRADMEMVLEMTAADLGGDAGDIDKMTLNMKADLRYSDHNKPVTITLPPEAASAKEVPAS